jgi:NAD-dependent deacetylase
MLREMDQMLEEADPNPGHRGLARLEELGVLTGIVTQNIDNLHQEAGSQTVIEFHGNGRRLVCLACRTYVDAKEARARWEEEFPPRCPTCNAILKPDVVFFGEAIPAEAGSEAMRLAQGASVILVVGTSAVVAPASYIPVVAKKMGAMVAVFDLEPTVLSHGLADHTVLGKAGETVPALVEQVEAMLGQSGT